LPSPAHSGCEICWRTYTFWSRCSTRRSIIGLATTRWKSSCGKGKAGSPRTRNAMPSLHAICATTAALRATHSPGWPKKTRDPEAAEQAHSHEELTIEAPLGLWEQRIGTVLSTLRALDVKSVADLGCGEGKLLKPLLQDKAFERVLGMDVSWRSLETARR